MADWAPSEREGDKLLFVFFGGALSPKDLASIDLQREELELWKFHDPSQFSELMPNRLARRLVAALDSMVSNTTGYLERGAYRAE